MSKNDQAPEAPANGDPSFRFMLADTPEEITALIERDAAAGPATPADVRQAEQEAAEAAALVEALESRVVDGDDAVTPEEIANAESLGRFARLRAKATRVKAERAARAERLRALDELRAEMEAYATDTGPRLAGLLAEAEKAVTAYLTAVQQRNDNIRSWNHRMRLQQVPRHISATVPAAEHAHLGHDGQPGGEVIAGRRRLRPLDPAPGVVEMIERALAGAGLRNLKAYKFGRAVEVYVTDPNDKAAPYSALRRLDAPTGEAEGSGK